MNRLYSLEESLWIAQLRFDRSYMDSILTEDFFEFGRSGCIYNREEVMNMPYQEINIVLPLQNFQLRYISNDVIQCTYVSEVVYNDEIQLANRSSIWVKKDEKWQLCFHQGTPF